VIIALVYDLPYGGKVLRHGFSEGKEWKIIRAEEQ